MHPAHTPPTSTPNYRVLVQIFPYCIARCRLNQPPLSDGILPRPQDLVRRAGLVSEIIPLRRNAHYSAAELWLPLIAVYLELATRKEHIDEAS